MCVAVCVCVCVWLCGCVAVWLCGCVHGVLTWIRLLLPVSPTTTHCRYVITTFGSRSSGRSTPTIEWTLILLAAGSVSMLAVLFGVKLVREKLCQRGGAAAAATRYANQVDSDSGGVGMNSHQPQGLQMPAVPGADPRTSSVLVAADDAAAPATMQDLQPAPAGLLSEQAVLYTHNRRRRRKRRGLLRAMQAMRDWGRGKLSNQRLSSAGGAVAGLEADTSIVGSGGDGAGAGMGGGSGGVTRANGIASAVAQGSSADDESVKLVVVGLSGDVSPPDTHSG